MTGIGSTERQRIQIDSQARAWQLKVQRGGLQQGEMEEFGHWMAIPEHAAAFADCEWSTACIRELDEQDDAQWSAWKEEAMQRARTHGPKVEPLANWSDLVPSPRLRPQRREGFRLLKPVLAVAACLVLVTFVFFWQHTTTTNVLHYQAGDAPREVLLPDGTRLTLDAGTAVDYVKLDGIRRLLLAEGRVYLNVSKDPQRAKFVVQSGQIETVVLGTRFQVSQTTKRTEVVLEEGKVRMQRPGTTLFTTLTPGERGWWTTDATRFHTAAATPSSALAWMRGRLLFENVSLAQAIVDVNRYSKHLQIELADPRVGELKVNGSYLAGDAELVVAAWEATMPVRATQEGNRIKIGHK